MNPALSTDRVVLTPKHAETLQVSRRGYLRDDGTNLLQQSRHFRVIDHFVGVVTGSQSK
jgi:hypothetical protein